MFEHIVAKGCRGANRDDCVMVPNVATGINLILRSFPWKEGDRLIASALYSAKKIRLLCEKLIFIYYLASTAFHTISRSVKCLSDLKPCPSVSELKLNFPTSHSEILRLFREHLRASKKADTPGSTHLPSDNATVVLFDSIVSMPGVLMPWKDMVRICKEEGAWSVIDAAHSLGQETNFDLSSVDPDFWIAVGHF